MEFLFQLIIFVILLGTGYFVGIYFEKKHYADIRRREKRTLNVPLINFGAKTPLPEANEASLFAGSVVISSDYFKTFTATLVNIIGGRIVVYESLLDRGRREALLRMKEEAIAWGATQVVNVRLETSNISQSNSNNSMVAIEIIAYGTGIR
ncbi:MAG: heavy metal-binding domain-containing protein [Cyanobacteria bacterium P01_F01_bin.42]